MHNEWLLVNQRQCMNVVINTYPKCQLQGILRFTQVILKPKHKLWSLLFGFICDIFLFLPGDCKYHTNRVATLQDYCNGNVHINITEALSSFYEKGLIVLWHLLFLHIYHQKKTLWNKKKIVYSLDGYHKRYQRHILCLHS